MCTLSAHDVGVRLSESENGGEREGLGRSESGQVRVRARA